MNARQFFYKNVLPNLTGISYQKSMNYKLVKNDKYAKKIWRHLPKLSNDRHIEDVIKNLLDEHIPQIFRSRLEHMFVAKLSDHQYQAKALIAPGQYRGDLIYYYVGLADCIFEISIYYIEFSMRDWDINIFEKQCMKLMEMVQVWKNTSPLKIDLNPNLVVTLSSDEQANKAASIATLTDKFVICHEIAHHLLGHTGKIDDASFLLEKLPEELKSWKGKSINSAKELQADALATLFMLKISDTQMIQGICGKSQNVFEASLGCLLTLWINILLSNDPNKESNDYPSDIQRLESCFAILSYFSDPELPNKVYTQLSKMFGYFGLTDMLNHLIRDGASEKEIKSLRKTMSMCLM